MINNKCILKCESMIMTCRKKNNPILCITLILVDCCRCGFSFDPQLIDCCWIQDSVDLSRLTTPERVVIV